MNIFQAFPSLFFSYSVIHLREIGLPFWVQSFFDRFVIDEGVRDFDFWITFFVPVEVVVVSRATEGK